MNGKTVRRAFLIVTVFAVLTIILFPVYSAIYGEWTVSDEWTVTSDWTIWSSTNYTDSSGTLTLTIIIRRASNDSTISGATVKLQKVLSSKTTTKTSDSSGTTKFSGLYKGNYTIFASFSDMNATQTTYLNGSKTITILLGQENTIINPTTIIIIAATISISIVIVAVAIAYAIKPRSRRYRR